MLQCNPNFVVVGVDPNLLESDDVVRRADEVVDDCAESLVALLCDIFEAPVESSVGGQQKSDPDDVPAVEREQAEGRHGDVTL